MIKARIAKAIGAFSVPCFLLGLLFFAASLTPSLIPRGRPCRASLAVSCWRLVI
jgi:uncharacterized membrane protein